VAEVCGSRISAAGCSLRDSRNVNGVTGIDRE
jgi:hypothetical protein